MTVTLINPFVVPPEDEARFVGSWKETASAVAAAPGYVDTKLHRSLEPGARFRFVNVARWASPEAWRQAMSASPPREKSMAGVEASPALYRPLDGARSRPGTLPDRGTSARSRRPWPRPTRRMTQPSSAVSWPTTAR